VAYALTITDLDPLRYSLLFERFLNPERVSMPDFDIDFCMDRREEVINYVQQKYGQDKVGQIITFGALLSKAAIRDIGRVLQMPYGQVDTLAKLIPVDGVRPVSIAKALTDEPRLKDAAKQEEIVSRLLDYSEKVEGLLRNASTHAAGVVIGDRPLDELVPLYQDPRSTMVATQFSMKWVELSGLVKFDFLGLKTLTVIQNALNLLKTRNVIIDIGNVPLDDQKTFELYASAKTVAVFQVESSGMMDALRRMKPTCIEDIVALVALYRPGPMENIPAYCEVKNGLKELVSIHPLIDHILAETQGIIVYQEQVMEIAQVMAGYSLGGADLLRRAMGKKIKEAMDAERPKFMKGAGSKGVDEKKASEVFDLLEKFANYGFNKSHAAAYAIVSYQTAWLKANYPLEFMAGVMNCDMHLTDKLSIYKDEIINGLSLKIVPPCVNRSEVDFSVKNNELIYALTALKNVGPEAMQLIVEARKKSVSKKFNDIFEFARQVDMKKIGKRPLEMLVRAGAFDQLNSNRLVLLKSLDSLVAYSSAIHDQRSSNQSSLFGVAGEDLLEPKLKEMDFWLASEQLVEEHRAIGFYLSGHPLDDYKSSLKRNGITTLSELRALVKNGPVIAKVAGTISGRQDRKSARGNRFSFVQVSDPTGLYEVTVFSDVLDSSEEYLVAGENVVMSVEATSEAEQLKLLCRTAQPIDTAIVDKSKKGLKIFVNSDGTISSVASLLKRVEQEKNVLGRGEVSICLIDSELPGEVELLVGDSYPINPQVYNALKALKGVLSVEEY
jgi:DNA polymerase-3 subunit alpha